MSQGKAITGIVLKDHFHVTIGISSSRKLPPCKRLAGVRACLTVFQLELLMDIDVD